MKSLLHGFGIIPVFYEIDEILRGREIETALAMLGRNPVVPVVFFGGELVGGANEVMSLHLQRNLRPMLTQAGAM